MIGCGLTVTVIFTALAIWLGPVLADFRRAGFLDSVPEKRAYEGTSIENLRAMHTALMLYHDSEGQFPEASGWMDAARPYVKTADLADGEELKKFQNPGLGGGSNVFGYAMNDAASAMYIDDIEEPSRTPLVYETDEPEWNAHGTPTTDGLGIAIDGTLLGTGEKADPE